MNEERQNKTRSSNLELLRIFCILAIIGDHFVGQSGIANFSGYFSTSFYIVCVSLSRVACSVFIIISSWFLVDASFKVKRIFHTWLTVIMYTVPITLICKYIFHIEISKEVFVQAFFPIEECPLWFAGYYIVLIMLSPVLNLILRHCSKKSLEIILSPLVICMIVYSTITARLGFFAHEIWIFIFLYLFTGYLKLYPIHFFDKKKNCFLLFGFLEFVICFFKVLSILKLNDLYLGNLLAAYMEVYRARLQTIPNLLMAFSLFFGFKNMRIKNNKIINKIAATTLGVYCLHQVPCFYMFLWKNIMRVDFFIGSSYQYIYTIFVILLIWILGTFVEFIRNLFSSYLIENRKYYIRCCSYIDGIVNNVDIMK